MGMRNFGSPDSTIARTLSCLWMCTVFFAIIIGYTINILACRVSQGGSKVVQIIFYQGLLVAPKGQCSNNCDSVKKCSALRYRLVLTHATPIFWPILIQVKLIKSVFLARWQCVRAPEPRYSNINYTVSIIGNLAKFNNLTG